ncbi:MAG: DUF2811 domain-containing protein [Cyanobium sp.]
MSLSPDTAPQYVSVVNEFPEDLYDAMRRFVGSHPHWDQYRLMQVALAGFLFQQGSRERAVSRHYLDGLFDRGAAPGVPAAPAAAPRERPSTPPTGPVAAPHELVTAHLPPVQPPSQTAHLHGHRQGASLRPRRSA